MASCKQCGTEIERLFRFCPWCGQVQRLKLTEFFFGHAGIEEGSRRALPKKNSVSLSRWT